MLVLRIDSGRVGIRRARDLGHAIYARGVAHGMIEEQEIARLHASHIIPGLIIAYARPSRAPVAPEVVDGVAGGFGFYEPVVHGEIMA